MIQRDTHPYPLVPVSKDRRTIGGQGDTCTQSAPVSYGFPRSCPFPGVIPLQPSPKTPSQAPTTLSPPFSQRSEGARVFLMLSSVCLSHPSRVAGGGKHEKEPIWLLTSPPALLSLSSPLPYQPTPYSPVAHPLPPPPPFAGDKTRLTS